MDSLLDTLDLSPGKKQKIYDYIDGLYKFDKSKRLVGSENKDKWVINHIEDSIKACFLLDSYPVFYDLGSGNGLPGIVFSIIMEEKPIVLVDSDKKKIEFLKTMIYRLRLKASVICGNIQDLDIKTVPRGTVFMYRAFSPKEIAVKFIESHKDFDHVLFASDQQNINFKIKKTLKYSLSNGSLRKLQVI